MINGQKFSPEYWVVHDKKSDDVYRMFEEDEDLECILVEIKRC